MYQKLISIISKKRFLQQSFDNIQSNKSFSIKYLNGSLKSLFVASICQQFELFGKVIIAENRESAEDWLHDLKRFDSNQKIAYLVEPKKINSKLLENPDELLGWLIEGLSNIINNEDFIAIVTPEIFDIEIPEQKQIIENKIYLKKNQNIDFNDLIKNLMLGGFARKEYVEEEGDIAIRGGIIDIYPIGFENPLRLEFWGNDIESLRLFDILSQRSIRDLDEVSFISMVFHSSNTNTSSKIVDYLPANTLFFIDNIESINNNYPELNSYKNYRHLIINPMSDADITIKSSTQTVYRSSIKDFLIELNELKSFNSDIFIAADSKHHLERLQDLINASSTELTQDTRGDFQLPKIHWLSETLSSGFSLDDKSLLFFTEHQIFDRFRLQDKARSKNSLGLTLKEIYDLKIGDLVVHEDKGIAKFEGFKLVKIGGNEQDCVQLAFEGNDILYVNMNYIHKIQKYSSQEGIPKLSKLGSSEWARKKIRTKKRLKDIARDLIQLYADRKGQPGFAFSTDNTWQKEFEASFPYEDTPDQATTTIEVKNDMESDTPMDRLVCGDVGFGKTEIAIRAAFKAVQSGKQVAVLVPTTILAQQHYMTFYDRLNRYPIKVALLSRFKTKGQQEETLRDIQYGRADILIGTHRILSKDVEFKDLGLLIVDEEQRFGVSSKEKLRQMRVSIDTLTLTATPIPRTLNFSLMGARDLSIIETPPRNRLPVETEIKEWDEEEIASIINKEIERGGQVYFVSDKVMDLEKIMLDLKMQLPLIKFGIAHGQMQTKELEEMMQKFTLGKLDVLITTKIVESGLDIPNANTMIINRANNFGLAELYQLRGRVGRSHKQAFCYLVIPKNHKLGDIALKRLQAIEEFTDLGSGFKLAMRDLEIRGAGNLLGAEQSGVIYEIGFDLYQKILEEAVQELKHQEFADIFKDKKENIAKRFENNDIAIELNCDALLPSSYIPSDAERFSYYKRLYTIRTNGELQNISAELSDKYGKLPQPAKDLLYAVKVRLSAIATGFERIIIKDDKLVCELPNKSKADYYENAFPLVAEFFNSVTDSRLFEQRDKLMWETPISNRDEAVQFIWKVKRTIEILND